MEYLLQRGEETQYKSNLLHGTRCRVEQAYTVSSRHRKC